MLIDFKQIKGGSFLLEQVKALAEKLRFFNPGQSACNTLEGYAQITKMKATANTLIQIKINKSFTFCFPPLNVLKFAVGKSGQIVSLNTYDNSDSSKFVIGGKPVAECPYVAFDGTMHPVTKFNIHYGLPQNIGKGYIEESDPIDLSDYKNVLAIA